MTSIRMERVILFTFAMKKVACERDGYWIALQGNLKSMREPRRRVRPIPFLLSSPRI
jgi:hypothetical protein